MNGTRTIIEFTRTALYTRRLPGIALTKTNGACFTKHLPWFCLKRANLTFKTFLGGNIYSFPSHTFTTRSRLARISFALRACHTPRLSTVRGKSIFGTRCALADQPSFVTKCTRNTWNATCITCTTAEITQGAIFTGRGIHAACAILTGLACVTRAIDANARFTRLAHRAFRTAREGFFAQNTRCTTTGIGLFTLGILRARFARRCPTQLLIVTRHTGKAIRFARGVLIKTGQTCMACVFPRNFLLPPDRALGALLVFGKFPCGTGAAKR